VVPTTPPTVPTATGTGIGTGTGQPVEPPVAVLADEAPMTPAATRLTATRPTDVQPTPGLPATGTGSAKELPTPDGVAAATSDPATTNAVAPARLPAPDSAVTPASVPAPDSAVTPASAATPASAPTPAGAPTTVGTVPSMDLATPGGPPAVAGTPTTDATPAAGAVPAPQPTEAPTVGATAAGPGPAPVALAALTGTAGQTRDAQTVRSVRPALIELSRGLRTNGAGNACLVVRLDPPELGAVLVRVVLRGGSVSVSCRSADAGAVDILQQQRGEVLDVLKREGFDLSDYDVRQQSTSETGTGAHHDGPRRDPERAARTVHAAATLHSAAGRDLSVPAPTPSRATGTWL